MDEAKSNPWTPWCVAIAVFLATYVGSYALLRRPVPSGYGSALYFTRTIILRSGANYSVGGFAAKIVFMPLEILDNMVRPDAWVDW